MASKKLKWVRFEMNEGNFGFDRADVSNCLLSSEGGQVSICALNDNSCIVLDIKITLLEHLPLDTSKTPKHSVQHYRFEGHYFDGAYRVRGEFDFETNKGWIEAYGWGQL